MANSELVQRFLREYTGADGTALNEQLQRELLNHGYGRFSDPKILQHKWFQVCVEQSPDSRAAQQWRQYEAAKQATAALVASVPSLAPADSFPTQAEPDNAAYDDISPFGNRPEPRRVQYHVPHDIHALVGARYRSRLAAKAQEAAKQPLDPKKWIL